MLRLYLFFGMYVSSPAIATLLSKHTLTKSDLETIIKD